MHTSISPSNPGAWQVWQLIDATFPTGGFAHSAGIEAAAQHGAIRTAEDVADFLQQSLRQSFRSLLPFISAVHRAPETVLELDALLDSMLSSHVANRASRLQGHTLFSTAERVFPQNGFSTMRQTILAGKTPGHFVIAFAVINQGVGIDCDTSIRMFLFITLRGILSAAVRLGAIGPLQAQQLQVEMGTELESLAQKAGRLTLDDIAQTAPLIELWQATQDRLYSRLFQS